MKMNPYIGFLTDGTHDGEHQLLKSGTHKMIDYDPSDSAYFGSVMVDKIVRLSKRIDGEKTRIHLTTGEVIESNDSMHTLSARINSET